MIADAGWYKEFITEMEDRIIINVINEGKGTQFDPDVVAAFNQAYKAGQISDYMKSGKIP